MADRVEPPAAVGGYLNDPTIPGRHIGESGTQIVLQRTLPAYSIVWKQNGGVETSSVELSEPSVRVGVGRIELLENEIGGKAVQQALPKHADTIDVSGPVWAAKAQATVAKHQPGVAEIVGCHMECNITICRIDVLPPHPRCLEEVGVGVDEQAHFAFSLPKLRSDGSVQLEPSAGVSRNLKRALATAFQRTVVEVRQGGASREQGAVR